MNKITEWCEALPRQITEMIEQGISAVQTACPDERLRQAGRPVLVGSGAAYAAALAAKQAFAELSGWSGEWVSVWTVQQYTCMQSDAVQNTGAAHVLLADMGGEAQAAADAARERGARLTVLTDEPDGALAQGADGAVRLPRTAGGGAADDFLRLQLALMLVALQSGCAHGRLSETEAADRRRQMAGYVSACCQAAAAMAPTIEKAAREVGAQARNWEMMGTGPDYAVAWMARALAYQTLGTVCTVEEAEDWLHVNFLQLTPEAFGTILFVSGSNPSAERALRTVQYVEGIGRKTFVVTDLPAEQFPAGTAVLRLPAAGALWMQPLGMLFPAALLLQAMSS